MKLFFSGNLVARLASILFTGCLLLPLPALAQVTITPVTDLSFGVIAIRDYSAVGRVTINSGGSFTYNSNIWLHENPQRGEYRVDGGPPNTVYTVTVPPSATLTGPGGSFILDNFAIEPAVLITDASGVDTFYIIGRLQTQGGGINYGDGDYDTTFTVTVNF